ncbi:MAG: SWIM zinc finger family protein [Candidatus Lokiarchaeota archaeon]|nr:SWIM zinc finger family protein [Candidatus Lokiarchaeota archaeon]
MKIDNRKKEFLERRRQKNIREEPHQFKTIEEKKRTREEVEQIKKDLITFAKTPWGKRWIQSNLEIGRPFRMQRGIEYVKDNRRIDNISINPGQIFATVQGTAPTPYRVKINLDIIADNEWKLIVNSISDKAENLVNLIEGRLSKNIIEIIESTGQSLFPNTDHGLNASCSCPDNAVPCKHIAAVILYIARVLDYNPLLLFELAGKTKNDLFSALNFFKKTTPSKKSEKNDTKPNLSSKIDFEFEVPKILVKDLVLKQDIDLDAFNLGFKIKKPKKIIETVENLGIPDTIENKAFEIVFKKIYEVISLKIYELSRELD